MLRTNGVPLDPDVTANTRACDGRVCDDLVP